jgi:Ca2+-binding RTX toxin-like protein
LNFEIWQGGLIVQIASWLKNWSPTAARRKPNNQQLAVSSVTERLEVRALPASSVLFVAGSELNISLNVRDNVSVGSLSGAVVVQIGPDGGQLQPVALGTLSASSVRSIVITGGDAENTIDLSGVTSAAFTNLTSISVNAGNGNDSILGSDDFNDSLSGGDGADTIDGQAGSDVLDGGNGADVIRGGVGNDTINGGDGSDNIDAGVGNDNVDAGNGSDLVNLGDGDDVVNGKNGEDTINGGLGDDTINGDGGTDVINGDDGNDSILGGEKNDTLDGGLGNDIIDGQTGNDSIDGGLGDDSLLGSGGNDSLLGNEGNDTLNGGSGNDLESGGNGIDQIYGGSGDDSVNGDGGDDNLFGQSGDDTIIGGVGSDFMRGDAGNDLLDSGEGNPLPSITITGGSVAEGNSSRTNLPFTLTLSNSSSVPVTVLVSTADGAATAPVDYLAISNLLVTFAPGTITQTVNVQVNGDRTNEVNETVRLIMSSPTAGTLQNQEGVGTIQNDDPVGGLFGISGFGQRQDLVSISAINAATTRIAATTTNQSFDFEALDSNTAIGIDSMPNPRLYTMDLASGRILSTTTITNVTPDFQTFDNDGDVAYDPTTNSLYAYISAGASFGGSDTHLFRIDATTGSATDVGPLTAGGNNLSFFENDYLAMRNGTLYAIVTSSFDRAIPSNSLFTINPATAACTLVGPVTLPVGTFLSSGGSMTYDANLDRLFALTGFGGDLLSIDPTTGVATLVGSTGFSFTFDHGGLANTGINPPAVAPRTISVSDVSINEGNQGTQAVRFVVTCQPGAGNVTVDYQTADGVAVAGIDYVATSGSLMFPQTGGSVTVSVTINGDANFEADETLFLDLFNVSGAVISKGSGVATIVNDDPLPFGDTLLGGNGNDTLLAGQFADILSGNAGDDYIDTGAGDDSALGGTGNDTLLGQAGDDTLNGQGGNDVVQGSDGNDTSVWEGTGGGNDSINDPVGDNTLLVNGNGTANNFVIGKTVEDQLRISESGKSVTVGPNFNRVAVNGNNGNDTITVGNLEDIPGILIEVFGGNGNDSINASGALVGNVRLSLNGDAGNDTIFGSEDADTVVGGDGNDLLYGNAGDDTMIAGDGNDNLYGQAGNDSMQGNAGDDSLRGNDGNDTIEAGDGFDVLLGQNGDDSLDGGTGDDSLEGNAGADTLLGDLGIDTLTGGDGNDSLDGGRHDDLINGGTGDDFIRGDHGNDSIDAGDGNDTVIAGDGNDSVIGGLGNDQINGSDGNDIINSGGGDDIVLGGDGNDTLAGGGGSDVILGGDGDDSINGQGGNDTVAGNQGVDTIADPTNEINETFTLSNALLTALEAI